MNIQTTDLTNKHKYYLMRHRRATQKVKPVALLLKRNAVPEPWFHGYGASVKEGDIVALVSINKEPAGSARYPPEIRILQKKCMNDPYHYLASLCCFDYVGTTNE